MALEATLRRSKLVEIIRSSGFSSLPDLADALDVSESTVRRDLSQLEQQGVTRRTHGGAFYTGPSPGVTHFRHRQQTNWDKKKAIAAATARIIEEGDTLLLDGGSTLYEVARLLVNRSLQVVTNSLPVANLFSTSTSVDLVVLGGYVHNRSGAMHGCYADRTLESIRVQRAVMGAAAIDEHGMFNHNEMIATTERAMLRTAEEVIVAADSTKFGRRSLAHICELGTIDRLVVDDGLDAEWREKLTQAGIEVVLAGVDSAANDEETLQD